jgi:hypothetical protein
MGCMFVKPVGPAKTVSYVKVEQNEPNTPSPPSPPSTTGTNISKDSNSGVTVRVDDAVLELIDIIGVCLQVRKDIQAWLAESKCEIAKLGKTFDQDYQSHSMLLRSTNSLLHSTGAAQISIVNRHHENYYVCSQLSRFVELMSMQGSKLVQCDTKTRQCILVALLARRARLHHYLDAQISMCAVGLTQQLLCKHDNPTVKFLVQSLLVYLSQHGSILNDDYHTAFCVAVIGYSCYIKAGQVLKHVVPTLL